MDPITLHFNVFQAGTSHHGRHSLQVEEPQRQTVGALKHQLFADALQAQRSVRFIASGKILEDSVSLDTYNLGPESHICVSIGDRAPDAPKAPQRPTPAVHREHSQTKVDLQESLWSRFVSVILIAGSSVIFPYAVQKHRQLSTNTHLMLFIAAAVWVYFLLFHALPDAFKILMAALRWSVSRRVAAHSGPRMSESAASTPVAGCREANTLASRKPAAVEMS
mmetsp:Transcript_33778/g.78079  ORF Transcript_33778/g.78079 Transcript_33778/m.78079 type:complete len:222 (+) Transcript_33778:75-740(+)